jgi:hypothetical protein
MLKLLLCQVLSEWPMIAKHYYNILYDSLKCPGHAAYVLGQIVLPQSNFIDDLGKILGLCFVAKVPRNQGAGGGGGGYTKISPLSRPLLIW